MPNNFNYFIQITYIFRVTFKNFRAWSSKCTRYINAGIRFFFFRFLKTLIVDIMRYYDITRYYEILKYSTVMLLLIRHGYALLYTILISLFIYTIFLLFNYWKDFSVFANPISIFNNTSWRIVYLNMSINYSKATDNSILKAIRSILKFDSIFKYKSLW